jgi:regulatory protein
VAGRRARTGRGWDAVPPRARRPTGDEGSGDDASGDDASGAPGRPSRFGAPRTDAARPERPVDPAERAREICLRQLAVRPRTRAELAGALRQRGIADDVAAEVLGRYSEVGIIDDTAFARAWVTSRHHGRGLAGRALAGELRRKGVDADAVGQALAELDPEVEAQTARALVERKLRTEHGDSPEALLRRLVGVLARKGYAPGLAIRVVKEVLADRELEIAAEVLQAEADAAELADGTAPAD